MLTYYELDLGLNHIVRKWSTVIENTSNHMIPLPYTNGPSGVLICSQTHITYFHENRKQIKIPIPKRQNDDLPSLIISSCVHILKRTFFIFLMSENGDLFKMTVDSVKSDLHEIQEDSELTLSIKYFDTVSPGSSMCLLKTGFLFIPSEFGNQ